MLRMAVWVLGLSIGAAAVGAAQDVKEQVKERGEKVFAVKKCALCHSIAGKGMAKGPLDQVGSKLSSDEIRAWITDPARMAEKSGATRKPPMKPYALPKEDEDALVAYLSSLKKK